MKTYKNLYNYLCSMGNLTIAWRKARKGKTSTEPVIEFEKTEPVIEFEKTEPVIEFEKNLELNLLKLHRELISKTYKPLPLTTFILRDPKTRVISKSDFRDRVVHHALINVLGKIFEDRFIYDSCANQKKKGTLFALKRFDLFQRKVTENYSQHAFCLKADIKHYFQEIDHTILLLIIKRKITDPDVLWLIQQILNNNVVRSGGGANEVGMPLGNLTSQFFANVYLSELDYFVKHELKIKYYIRYVYDFVILHHSKKQLTIWKEQIDIFLREKLKIELHPQKSRIIPLSKGIDFIGFRNFYKYRLLRKRNILGMKRKVGLYKNGIIEFNQLSEIYQGWYAYAKWANTHKLRKKIKIEIVGVVLDKITLE